MTMMRSREHMVDQGAGVLREAIKDAAGKDVTNEGLVRAVLDDLYPIATTVEDLEALPLLTVMISDFGWTFSLGARNTGEGERFLWDGYHELPLSMIIKYAPLTVVGWPT